MVLEDGVSVKQSFSCRIQRCRETFKQGGASLHIKELRREPKANDGIAILKQLPSLPCNPYHKKKAWIDNLYFQSRFLKRKTLDCQQCLKQLHYSRPTSVYVVNRNVVIGELVCNLTTLQSKVKKNHCTLLADTISNISGSLSINLLCRLFIMNSTSTNGTSCA